MAPETMRRQTGFTLIELLVVVAIIGILASVAMAQYALYKQQAVDGLMESTLENGRHAMEAYFVQNNTYQTATEGLLIANYGFRRAAQATFTIADQQQLTFVIRVCSYGGTSPGWEFDSTVGRAVPTSTCP
jgi:prepilin-type N-terminal cleavage/methylation domain-containing protein